MFMVCYETVQRKEKVKKILAYLYNVRLKSKRVNRSMKPQKDTSSHVMENVPGLDQNVFWNIVNYSLQI